MITISLPWYTFICFVGSFLLLGMWFTSLVQKLYWLVCVMRQRGAKHGH